MSASGVNVLVEVNRSGFIGNQAIAAMPSSSSTGNALAGIAVGDAIESETAPTSAWAKA